MTQISLGNSAFKTSRLAYGCWRLAGSEGGPVEPTSAPGKRAIHTAVDAGYSLFDVADIYGGGRCEEILGEALRETPGLRERIVLVTKCGIRPGGHPAGMPGRYDFSREHILRSVDASLRRLGVATIDVLLLHRPDYLMDAAEVAGVFGELRTAGKVREFGVSNFRPSQVSLLQGAWSRPLLVNQIEMSLLQLAPLEDGTLDQCQAQRMTPMAWSPLGGGLLGDCVHGLLPGQRGYQPERVNRELDLLAAVHGVTRAVLAVAWLLKHPARIQPVIGSVEPKDITALTRAVSIELTRDEWYRLLVAARGAALP